MIIHNGVIAINLSQVKAIKTEFLSQGGHLIFELNNMIVPVENEETGNTELKSFPNDSVFHYFETSDSLRAYFDEWVEMWKDSQK